MANGHDLGGHYGGVPRGASTGGVRVKAPLESGELLPRDAGIGMRGPTFDRKTGYKTSGAGGDSVGIATAMAVGAGVSALSNIYGAKKAASVQEKALNQAQANLEKDAQQAEAAWASWHERQAPVMQTRNDALMAMRGQYKKRPEGMADLFTNEFRGWPAAPTSAVRQEAQPVRDPYPPSPISEYTMASVAPRYEQVGMGQGGIEFGQVEPVAMKDGGVVTQPTVALIGEAGPEAVVPLSGPSSSRGLGLSGALAGQYGQQIRDRGSSAGRMGDIGGGGRMTLMPPPGGGMNTGPPRPLSDFRNDEFPKGPRGGGVMPLPPGPWGGGGGGQMPPPVETSPDWPPFPRPTPGPSREGPLPDRRIPTPEDRRRQSARLARERRRARQRRKGGGMTAPTDFSV